MSGVQVRDGLGKVLLSDRPPLYARRVVDAEFGHPRLAAIYDGLDPDRSDLLPYLAIANEAGVERVLDVEIRSDLDRNGFEVLDVRQAPDRPGREFVFVAAARNGKGGAQVDPTLCR